MIAGVVPLAPVPPAPTPAAPLTAAPAPAAGSVPAGALLWLLRLLGRGGLAAFGRGCLCAALCRLVRH